MVLSGQDLRVRPECGDGHAGVDVQSENDSGGLWLVVVTGNLAGAQVGRPPPDVGVQVYVSGNVLGG
jgi:hypothetical protein